MDLSQLEWIYEPKLHLSDSDYITIETQPYSLWRESSGLKPCAELFIPVHGSFTFTACTEYIYANPFDQCGFLLYNGDDLKAVFGSKKINEEYNLLSSIVFYPEGGDRSGRDIGSALAQIYYRVWYRAGDCRIQYSFAGTRYTDLREFHVDPEVGITGISMFACSPRDSFFDCTFCHVELTEDEEGE